MIPVVVWKGRRRISDVLPASYAVADALSSFLRSSLAQRSIGFTYTTRMMFDTGTEERQLATFIFKNAAYALGAAVFTYPHRPSRIVSVRGFVPSVAVEPPPPPSNHARRLDEIISECIANRLLGIDVNECFVPG